MSCNEGSSEECLQWVEENGKARHVGGSNHSSHGLWSHAVQLVCCSDSCQSTHNGRASHGVRSPTVLSCFRAGNTAWKFCLQPCFLGTCFCNPFQWKCDVMFYIGKTKQSDFHSPCVYEAAVACLSAAFWKLQRYLHHNHVWNTSARNDLQLHREDAHS